MNLFVGGFPRELTEDELKEIFEAFGNVTSVKIIKDKFTGEPRGFGFVDMPSRKEAEAAMDGITIIKDRMVTINEARPRNDQRRSGGGRRDSRNRGSDRRRGGNRY